MIDDEVRVHVVELLYQCRRQAKTVADRCNAGADRQLTGWTVILPTACRLFLLRGMSFVGCSLES
jgi:hypothetical protein